MAKVNTTSRMIPWRGSEFLSLNSEELYWPLWGAGWREKCHKQVQGSSRESLVRIDAFDGGCLEVQNVNEEGFVPLLFVFRCMVTLPPLQTQESWDREKTVDAGDCIGVCCS